MDILAEKVKGRIEVSTGKNVELAHDGEQWHLSGGLGRLALSSEGLLALVTVLEEAAVEGRRGRVC